MAKEKKSAHAESEGERLARKKKKKRRKALLIVLLVLVLLVLLLAGIYFGMRAYGKYQLEKKGTEKRPALEKIEDEEIDLEVLDENSVRYQGTVYTYNEDIMNIVFMGIDRGEEEEEGEGSRSDVVILAVVDNHNKKVTLFNLNRNTMTDIAVYDENGNYLRQSKGQLALSHAYGDGKEQSAKLVCNAVSNLMYGLGIHGYCALDFEAIPIANDMIGGVTVTIPEDYTDVNSSFVKGAQVTLKGEDALTYVRFRDAYAEGANEARMERQKQYMKGLVSQAKSAFQQDMTMPLSLYQEIQPYMVTDISAGQVTYLVTQIIGYEINTELQTLPGTVQQGGIYDEYYVDEKALYDLIIHTFYLPEE